MEFTANIRKFLSSFYHIFSKEILRNQKRPLKEVFFFFYNMLFIFSEFLSFFGNFPLFRSLFS